MDDEARVALFPIPFETGKVGRFELVVRLECELAMIHSVEYRQSLLQRRRMTYLLLELLVDGI